MLFKISNEKVDRNTSLPENSLTFLKTHIPGHPSNVEEKREASKLIPCLISILILIIVVSVTFSVLFYMKAFSLSSSKVVEVGVCHYKHKTGSCMARDSCCDGEYVIGKTICTGTQFCCMGTIRKCTGNRKHNRSDFWSFEALTQISSKMVFRNVSESLVEQAIVISVSAVEEMQYFHEMSEKIGTDISAVTQQKWFSIVGNTDSFDLNLNQFSAFILVTINELEVLLFRIAQNIIPHPSIDYSSPYELYQHNIGLESGLSLEDHDYGLDSRPTFDIIRSELNDSMREFAIQTIDYVINSCLNNYECISSQLVRTLNQQFQSKGGEEWQTIVTSNTIVEQMIVDINYLHGFLLDGIFNNRHRILIYKIVIKAKETEEEVIKSGRKALAMNKTIIYENSFLKKSNETKFIEDIRRAVMSNNKLLSICRDLTSVSTKYLQSWGCVAGPHRSFSYNMRTELSKHYLVIKLNELSIILFKKSCNKGFRI